MTIQYLQAGEHRLPDLHLPYQPKANKYARMRKMYLKNHRPNLYTTLLLKGELSQHLSDTGMRAQHQVEVLMAQLANETIPPPPGDAISMAVYQNALLKTAEAQILPQTVFA